MLGLLCLTTGVICCCFFSSSVVITIQGVLVGTGIFYSFLFFRACLYTFFVVVVGRLFFVFVFSQGVLVVTCVFIKGYFINISPGQFMVEVLEQ